MATPRFFVLTHRGDAVDSVDTALAEQRLSREAAGVHRLLYVTRADQTVLMAHDEHAPVVPLLLARGWDAPGRSQ